MRRINTFQGFLFVCWFVGLFVFVVILVLVLFFLSGVLAMVFVFFFTILSSPTKAITEK